MWYEVGLRAPPSMEFPEMNFVRQDAARSRNAVPLIPHEFHLQSLKLQHEFPAAAEVGLLGLRTAAARTVVGVAAIRGQVVAAVNALAGETKRLLSHELILGGWRSGSPNGEGPGETSEFISLHLWLATLCSPCTPW
jgi:hypothetical protein